MTKLYCGEPLVNPQYVSKLFLNNFKITDCSSAIPQMKLRSADEMQHLHGNGVKITSEEKYNDFNKLMPEYVVMALVISLLICDRSFFHYYLFFLKTNDTVSTKKFVRPYQLETAMATSDYNVNNKFMLSPDYAARRASPPDVHDLSVVNGTMGESTIIVLYFIDLIFDTVQNEQETVYILLNSFDCGTESDAYGLPCLILIVSSCMMLVSFIELQIYVTYYLQFFANDTVTEDRLRELCGVRPTAVEGMFHSLSIRRPKLHLSGLCQEDVRQHGDNDHSENANSHQGSECKNSWGKLKTSGIKTFNLLLLSVLLFSFLKVSDAQPSFFHQDNKYVDLFAESDLLFSNDMMRKAGCSYHYSTSTQLDTPQPVLPKLESVNFCDSGNVYLNLQICEPKKLLIQHESGSLEFREHDSSSKQQYVYMCITSLWSCGAWFLMAVVSFIFEGGKTTGLSLFVLGFKMAKHEFSLQPYRSTIFNNKESEVLEVLALYDLPTTNYPIAVANSCFNKPSCLMKEKSKKSDSELAYRNYKPFYVTKLASDACFMQANDGRTLNGRNTIGYCSTKCGITKMDDASRTGNLLTTHSDTDQQVMATMVQILPMAVITVLVLTLLAIAMYALTAGAVTYQAPEQGNGDNSALYFGNINPILYQTSADMPQSKVIVSLSQMIGRVINKKWLHPGNTSDIVGFEIVQESSSEQTAGGKQTDRSYKQPPCRVQLKKSIDNSVLVTGTQVTEKSTNNTIMVTGTQEHTQVDVKKNRSDLVL